MATSDLSTGTHNQGTTHAHSGGMVGKVLDALTGEKRTHKIDREREEAYWSDAFKNESYFKQGRTYDDYAPAYRTGYESVCNCAPGTRFEDMEPTLRENYTASGGKLAWDEARPAALAAWDRVSRGESFTVPLSEEELKVGKREVKAGAAHIRKVVKTETVSQPVELRREEAVIERVTPTSQQVPSDAFQEKEISVPLKREEAVVQKTAHVTGEVKVTKGAQSETQHVQEQLRKEDVIVEKEGGAEIRREGDLKK